MLGVDRSPVGERAPSGASLGARSWLIVAVLVFFSGFLVVVLLVAFPYRLQLQGARGHHFKIGATLHTRNNFAFVDFVGVYIQIAVALGTRNHRPPFQ